MNIRVDNGLPIATVELMFQDCKKILDQVLIDTGCAVTIFDTDVMAEIGVTIDFVNGIPTTCMELGERAKFVTNKKSMA